MLEILKLAFSALGGSWVSVGAVGLSLLLCLGWWIDHTGCTRDMTLLKHELAAAQRQAANMEAALQRAYTGISELQTLLDAKDQATKTAEKKARERDAIISKAASKAANPKEVLDDESSKRVISHLSSVFGNPDNPDRMRP